MTAQKFLLFLPLAIATTACAPQTKYYWGDYSSSLNNYYNDPTTEAKYDNALLDVTSAESQGKTVPPGLYAEYGYDEMSRGDTAKAIDMFEREKHAWPESAVFMDKAIATAKAAQRPTPASGGGTTPATKTPIS